MVWECFRCLLENSNLLLLRNGSGLATPWYIPDCWNAAEMVWVLGQRQGATVGQRQRKIQEGRCVRRHRERQKCRNVEESKEYVWTHKGRYYEEKENRHIVCTRDQVEVMRPVALEVDSNCPRARTRLWVILKEVYMNSSVQVKSLSDQIISSKLYIK